MQEANVSIRFWDVSALMKGWQDKMFVCRHFSEEMYFRFFIPLIFFRYQRVLYIDCDIVARRDVALLYETALSDNEWLGAAHDAYSKCMIYKGDKYPQDKLKLQNPINYFQSGVLLFNNPEMISNGILEKSILTLERLVNPRYPDQDVLNMVCEGHVKFLDMRWNVEWHLPITDAKDYENYFSPSEKEEYEMSYNDPWCLHYCGTQKPWKKPSLPHSFLFWEYARRTPFYEQIVYKNIKPENTKIEPEKIKRAIRGISELPELERKLCRVKLRLYFAIGKRRKKLKVRKQELKKQIKEIHGIIRNI